ncbi:MAG: CYTH domain-containing protein [Hyphomicrobiales bacterium]|nr:CYTH domain-containing protein [Hyphomicrobiales bacterium]
MATEIERKFLVSGAGWRSGSEAAAIRQGYLTTTKTLSVRVRTFGEQAFLTIKGAMRGLTRAEYEYAIPVADANELLDTLCHGGLIEKTRYTLIYAGHEWVVDEFAGDNAGLTVAEVELADENESVNLPPWIGEEVTDDPRYLNANLVLAPFRSWAAAQ